MIFDVRHSNLNVGFSFIIDIWHSNVEFNLIFDIRLSI